jgi:tetratricopeptide (TPR) repeat protein
MSTTAGSAPADRARAADWLVPLLLVAAVALVYRESLRNGFVFFDDGAYITENPRVQRGLTWEGVRWAFGWDFHASNWHPLTWLGHMLDVELFGLDPAGHHAMSAGLHALNACLCFWALRRLTGASAPCALVALLFAVHPQRVESVAWAAERKDVLAGTFFFLTLLLYARHARAPSPARLACVTAALALGLLAKPMLVSVPLVLLLLDHWPLERLGAARTASTPSPAPTHRLGTTRGGPGGPRVWLEKAPLVALSALSCGVTLLAQSTGGAVRSLESLSIGERCASALLGTVEYVLKACWPAGLAYFYPHPAFVFPESFSPLGARVLFSGAGLLIASGLAWSLRRRLPPVFVGWFLYLAMLLPVVGLVQVGAQRSADRYAYLPTLGLYLALVFGLERALASARARRVLWTLGHLAALALALVARRQVGFWKDGIALAERALKVTERNYVAHDHLGFLFQKRGQLDLAREHYEAALAIAPLLVDVHSNLGALYQQLGERELARRQFEEALRLQPDYLDARLNWGLLCEQEGALEQALGHYERAARAHPESAAAWTKLGQAALALGRTELGLDALARALERDGGSARANAELGNALLELGRTEPAREHLGEALRLDPHEPGALHGLAFLRASSSDPALRDPAAALELLAGCPARGEASDWRHLRALAAALAARERYAEAAQAAAEALARAPRSRWAQLGEESEVYRRGEALRR